MAADTTTSAPPNLEKLSLKEGASAAAAAPAAAAGSTGDDASKEEASPSSQMANSSLYVGELNPLVTEAILFEIFSTVGNVASIRVCRDAVTQNSLGYAYVNYANAPDARKALDDLNYAVIKGRPCRIMWSQRDPSQRRNGRGNVYIKNLDPTIDNKSLHDTFSAFGDVLSCKVVTDGSGRSLGFGFIHFATAEAAEEAIQTVNGMVLNGQAVYVAHHVPRSERESQAASQRAKFTNVYVKNLDPTKFATNEDLEKLFSKFGSITSAVLSSDSEGKSKGFGFVNFSEHEAAQKAVDELNDTEVEGKKLYVGRAQTKFERQNELKRQHDQQRQEMLTRLQGINLYVKNLDDTIDDEKLKEAFAPFGTITSARVMTDDSGKSRGFGFVCYSATEEASRAISEMNQNYLGSKPIYVALAQRKDMRNNQMRQQLAARQQLRQQQHLAGGVPPQFLPPNGGAPMMYGQPPFVGGPAPGPGGKRGGGMYPPQGAVPLGQWPPQGVPAAAPGGRFPGPPTGPAAPASAPVSGESLEQIVNKAPEEARKQIIGEALYPKILASEGIKGNPELASKITGMLLDMDNSDLFALAESEAALSEQVNEALSAYKEFLASQKASK